MSKYSMSRFRIDEGEGEAELDFHQLGRRAEELHARAALNIDGLASKVKMMNNAKVAHLHTLNNNSFKQVQDSELPFHRWYKWLEQKF